MRTHNCTRLSYALMVAAKRLFSNGVVMIENKCPNTRASNSVGLKSIALLKPNNKLKIISTYTFR